MASKFNLQAENYNSKHIRTQWRDKYRHLSQPKDVINIHQLTKHFWTSQCSETRDDCNFFPTMSYSSSQRKGNIQVRDFHITPSGQKLEHSCTHLQLGGGSYRWSEWLQHETPRQERACSRHQSTWYMDDPWNGKIVEATAESQTHSGYLQWGHINSPYLPMFAHLACGRTRADNRRLARRITNMLKWLGSWDVEKYIYHSNGCLSLCVWQVEHLCSDNIGLW